MAHKIVKIFDKRMENDIRYRGPLSYRHLMILGWISMAFKLLSIILSIGDSLDLPESQSMQTLEAIANFSGNFALPLFLFANFAIILDRKNSYKRQLLWFGGLSALIVFLFILFKEHYIVGIISALLGDRDAAEELIDDILYSLSLKGSLVFNLFIDLFMCTLLMFFLNYVPKRFFTGGKKKLFRLFALVPILYETGSLIVRIVMAYGVTTPNYLIYPFLTTKPFMSFVLFLILVLHLKFQERRLRTNGIGLEEYQAYTRTNAHSLRFSVYASVMILITAVIDFILYVIVSLAVLLPSMMESEIISEEALSEITAAGLDPAMQMVSAWGLGNHTPMIGIIPFLLLFSYTRTHKNPDIDKLIPAAGIILTMFTGLETIYRVIVTNIPAIISLIEEMATELIVESPGL